MNREMRNGELFCNRNSFAVYLITGRIFANATATWGTGKSMRHLENFKSVAINLQECDLTLSDARYVLDKVCEDYAEMSFYLHSEASIVQDKKSRLLSSRFLVETKNSSVESKRLVSVRCKN